MAQVIRPLSNTISIMGNSGNTVYGAKIVMVHNRGNQYEIVNVKHANNVLIGNIPIEHGAYHFLQKDSDDKISGNNIVAVSIAWPKG